ncbi:unnamed protein product [Periconia digitata]|uniref:Uncharacterized protein n=1 Tax=Periconia digitata TaxID=1303443 RepID=A0A9W4UAQ4_9PLEO|nr:unnamed protein product [Periconia digitata]
MKLQRSHTTDSFREPIRSLKPVENAGQIAPRVTLLPAEKPQSHSLPRGINPFHRQVARVPLPNGVVSTSSTAQPLPATIRHPSRLTCGLPKRFLHTYLLTYPTATNFFLPLLATLDCLLSSSACCSGNHVAITRLFRICLSFKSCFRSTLGGTSPLSSLSESKGEIIRMRHRRRKEV